MTRTDIDAFTDWLDDAGRRSAMPASDKPELSAICEGVRQVEAMDRHLEAHAMSVAPPRTPWESVLAAASPPALGMPNRSHNGTIGKETNMDAHLASPVPAPFMARDGIGTIAIRVVSVAAVLAILVASSGAVWLNRERLFGGNGDGGPQVPYGSFMMPNGQEVEVAYDVPSAEDCTVEPLNVDGVLRKLEAWPAEWEFGAPGPWAEGHTGDTEGVTATSPPEPTADDGEGQSPATSTAPIQVSGTPDATRPYDKMISPYILPEATFDEVAAVQRQWLACALFGSPFQRWALETNRLVTQEFQARYFPVFDMAQIRGDLEALARGDDNPFTNPVLTDGSLLPMVPAYTNGYYNVMRASWDVSLTVVWVRPDGTPILNANEEFVKSPNLERWLPNVWRFLKSPETGQWYLGSTSVGMG